MSHGRHAMIISKKASIFFQEMMTLVVKQPDAPIISMMYTNNGHASNLSTKYFLQELPYDVFATRLRQYHRIFIFEIWTIEGTEAMK